MKKIITLAACALFAFSSMLGVAQTDKKEAPKAKQETPAPGTSGQKLKKDGTPDMRYKENKEAAKPAAGPMKKDGTPDMRHKANKEAAAKKK